LLSDLKAALFSKKEAVKAEEAVNLLKVMTDLYSFNINEGSEVNCSDFLLLLHYLKIFT